ncbi:MAG: hypothetical protein WDO73_33690 [Ignavibacteriota bacterium]
MERNRAWKFAPLVIVAMATFGFVVMYLWNWLVPTLFGGHTITYWQTWGVIVLSKILFGGFSGRSGARGGWKRRMRDRWEQMTPEEREKFLHGMHGHCGPGAPEQA